jgi:hypothetical protein
MAKVSEKLPEFPGFSVCYDPSEKPFFVSNVLEDLRRIISKPIGKKLLDDINDARPRVRSVSETASEGIRDIVFVDGINVVMTPTTMTFIQKGYKMGYTGKGTEKSLQPSTHALHNIDGCTFYPTGGSCAEAGDIMAAGSGGCVSVMKYTNAQIMTAKGEATVSFLVLAHELIHSLHHVTGTRKDEGEELWTTGIGIYKDEPMSENAFRAAFGIALRTAY